MGIFSKIFGGQSNESKPGSREARGTRDDMLDDMMGVSGTAESSGGYPVCFKCGYKFPMTEKYIREQSDGGGITVTCPKCLTIMRLKD